MQKSNKLRIYHLLNKILHMRDILVKLCYLFEDEDAIIRNFHQKIMIMSTSQVFLVSQNTWTAGEYFKVNYSKLTVTGINLQLDIRTLT